MISNIIEPLPRYFTIRFGRKIKVDDTDDENNDNHNDDNHEQKVNEAVRSSKVSTDEDHSSSIVISGIRNRDWSFHDDLQNIKDTNMPNIKYQFVPSTSNTMRNHSA
ncbi:unnamed protein product, partial [Rotaria magnacalcarata]